MMRGRKMFYYNIYHDMRFLLGLLCEEGNLAVVRTVTVVTLSNETSCLRE